MHFLPVFSTIYTYFAVQMLFNETRQSGGRVAEWLGALTPTVQCSTLCGVVGSSPIAAWPRGPPHHRGVSRTVIFICYMMHMTMK